MPRQATQEEFIQRAKSVHGDKYDYSKVNYINNRTKVEIICKEHGSFWQRPYSHLHTLGCFKCSKLKLSKDTRWNLKQFIEKSNIVHNNKYDYSKVVYINSQTYVTIICKIHGEFRQKANHHLNGHGCPVCSDIDRRKSKTHSNEIFIKKANKIHDNKYDYTKCNYIHNKKKVCIICSKHGEFWQIPHSHLNGKGCPKCNSSKGEIRVRNWLIKYKFEFEEQKRFKDCRNKRPLPFDFYIPKYNLCIEFDGKQHYKMIQFFGDNKDFKKRQFLDKIKTDYCLTNNIKLIRIKYDENIEEKLNKELLV